MFSEHRSGRCTTTNLKGSILEKCHSHSILLGLEEEKVSAIAVNKETEA